MKNGIGLCGAHRVGKTTLAQALSCELNIPFLKTSTSEQFKKHMLSPSEPMNFDKRLFIQREILQAGKQVWDTDVDKFITDRTPLDMAAYTLADINGVTQVDFKELKSYINDCFDATQHYFSTLVIIPPGIPLVHEEGKAALNEAYIEHIHTLIVGLCHDERFPKRVFALRRNMLSLDERLNEILSFLRKQPYPHG